MTTRRTITLLLAGDVMTGRGIDQVMPHPSDPALYEPWVRSASDYVELAERANGRVKKPVTFDYVWGDALDEIEDRRPDVRIVNLETAVTDTDVPWPKGINYRMNPANVRCLVEAGIDCCVLANNHVLDWGPEGLRDTLAALRGAGLATAGAGRNRDEAAAPAIFPVPGKGRVIVYAAAFGSSGVPDDWAALDDRPGVNVLPGPSDRVAEQIGIRVRADKRAGDVVVFSVHWGGNWGYGIPVDDMAFAHKLVEVAGVDVIHGHSSHHPKAIEVYRGTPVLYGCGDLLNDYEGISGHDDYQPQLTLMYFVEIEIQTGTLASLGMVPLRIRNFRLGRPNPSERARLLQIMKTECGRFGGSVAPEGERTLRLSWR